MRVSKVNVKVSENGKTVNKMVLMHRTTSEGALVYDEKSKRNRTKEIIPDKKKESFNLSITNKTIIRYEIAEKNKQDLDKYKIVEAVFKRSELPQQISAEDVLQFLNHKFQKLVTYYKDGKPKQLNLVDCIVRAVERRDINELQPYYDWIDWYINFKSDDLKKSINNNIVQTGDGHGKRQMALQAWEPELQTNKGHLDLNSYHDKFDTDKLAADLCRVPIGELKENGTPKDINTYHRNLKKALQNHQAIVFGKSDAPINRTDDQLAIYNLEIVKYLEHYFPIKKSLRRNTADDIAYYLKAGTIKRTVANQLENAVRANLLRKGKYQHHALGADTTSETLSKLKRDEAFVKNLISTSAFAANNIRNITDPEQVEDILGNGNFKMSLAKSVFNKHTYSLFFPVADKAIDSKDIWAMRGAVQKIRNIVAHYKKDAIKQILDIKQFEYPDSEEIAFSDTIYKQLFRNEADNLQSSFALQLKSGGVLANYSVDQLKQLLAKVEFQLCRTVIPFAPGFKKVMKGGSGYQNSNPEKDFYDLELKTYWHKNNYSDEAWSGRYFLLKTIYNYLFLPEFTSDVNVFADTVTQILKKNRQQAQQTRNRNAYAFAEVRFMRRDESILDYMAYVQSQWMQEQNKKADGNEDDTRINFEKFILQLFIKGFDTFMQRAEFDFINTPQPQINISESNKMQAEQLNEREEIIRPLCRISSNDIDPDKDEHIAFYIYCKLLDASHLSTLRNELIKYRLLSQTKLMEHLPAIIELCLISADCVPKHYKDMYASSEECLDRLKPFIADGVDYTKCNGLYVQADEQTPVIHAGIELSIKYSTVNLLEQLINADDKFKITDDKFKITDDNFTKWNNLKKDIQANMEKHTAYHAAWVEAKEKDDKERREKAKNKSNFARRFVEEKGTEYINNCITINNYNWLDNKLHFEHLKSLHHLTVEILGRMAGFVTQWERDFQYLDEYRVKTQGGDPLKFSHGIPKEKEVKKYLYYFDQMFLCPQYRNIRNHIAHFNYLTTTAEKYSLIGLINCLRDLLHYDRKLKNAVSQSFIDLFDKHGMILKLKFDSDNHSLVVESISPKKIYHLGTEKAARDQRLITNQVQTEYCNLCKSLLELKK